jgi:uncharacterized protein (DUF2062 family)
VRFRFRVASDEAVGNSGWFIDDIRALRWQPKLAVQLVVACALVAGGVRGTVFVSNPFTWLPQVIGSLWVGAKLMGVDLMPFLHQLKHRNLGVEVHQLWAPLLLGALVLGLVAAGCGYVLAQCAWRARVLYHLRRRRARSIDRGAALR